jgi:hypothetical protein
MSKWLDLHNMTPQQQLDRWRERLAEARRWHRDAPDSYTARQVPELEHKVRIYELWAALDWSRPTPENGFYEPGNAELEPDAWLFKRERSAEELLREWLVAGHRDQMPPLLIPPERNPYAEWVADDVWARIRGEVIESERSYILREIERALRIAKGQTGFSRNLMRAFRGREEFVALNALDPDLSRDPAKKELEHRARWSRAVALLYAALADGLEAEDA